MSRLCKWFGHSYREAYDESPNPTALQIKKMDYGSPETVRAVLYYRTVNRVYCKRCGRTGGTE